MADGPGGPELGYVDPWLWLNFQAPPVSQALDGDVGPGAEV